MLVLQCIDLLKYETELGYKKKKENKETLGNGNHLDRITDLD